MPLLSRCTSHYRLGEASPGQWVDNVNTAGNLDEWDASFPVANGTGIIGGCVDFDGTIRHRLDVGNYAPHRLGTGVWAMTVWLNCRTIQNSRAVSKWANGSPYEWVLGLAAADSRYRINLYDGTSSTPAANAVWNANVVTDTWELVYVFNDQVNNICGISVNAGTVVTNSYGAGPTIAENTASPTNVGEDADILNQYDGLVDQLAFWNARLDEDGDLEALYNGGAGLDYPFSVGGSNPANLGDLRGGGESRVIVPPFVFLT